jgi:hypothetical protein
MAYDITSTNVSDTFKHLLQVRADDKTVYDALGNKLDQFRLSGSFTTSKFFELENSDSVTGNKLHSRNGTLYWGGTNLETGGSGLSALSEDTTPQLGGDLDINSKDTTGTGNFLVNGSGSFTAMNIGATSNTFDAFFHLSPSTVDKDLFLIKSGSFESLKVSDTGVVNFGGFTTQPATVEGGLYYNTTENEFYLGL